jgi:two-component system response regulator AtoC
MIRKIVLVAETPEARSELVRSLAANGVQVLQHPTLHAATSLLRDAEKAPSVLVLDMQLLAKGDADLLVDLSLRNPRMQIMLFPSKASGEEPLSRLKNCNVKISAVQIEDPAAFDSILHALDQADVLPDSHEPGVLSGSDTKGIHEEPVRRSGKAYQEATDSLYDEEFLRRVGRSDVPVLLHGETGAGKEVMARKLWTYSNRVAKPFLKLNCAALPSELIESELFGYEKGAFTGAIVDKPGKFELAQDGTILLDEIGDMDTRLQAKLLQVLQDGEVQPLGSSRIIKVNVRIMAATHRDLHAAIAQGSFREDLYYRLSVINITIPPLRERRHEIIPLAQQLLARHVGSGLSVPSIPDGLRRAMLDHRWPGNVRELENVMRRFLVYQDAALLAAELSNPLDLPKPRLAVARPSIPDRAAPRNNARGSFDHFAEASRIAESQLLLETLESVRWNRRQAALQLNIDYKALLYKLQKHGIVESKAKRREVSA